jgi:RND family efflux transporter MFP subunit
MNLNTKTFFRLFTPLMMSGVASIFISCKDPVASVEQQEYPVLHPVVQSSTYKKEYVADIQSVKYVELRSRVKGYLEKIHVDEGQVVQQGQLLFSISSKAFEIDLQKANASVKVAVAELKAAEVELENIGLLVEKNISSKAELAMIKAKVDALKAKVEEAQAQKEQAALNLSFSQIRAPFKGKINRLPKKQGSLVEEADVLTTISNSEEVFAWFNLAEADYLNYRKEIQPNNVEVVQLILSNGDEYPYQGRIEITESEFDQATGNIAFRARFNNPLGVLKHGSNGKIILTKNLKDALVIPQKSTFEIQDQLYVYVLQADSSVQQVSIEVAYTLQDIYVVEKGITSKDWIVYEGLQGIRPGDKIIPKSLNAEETKALFTNN